MEFIGSLKFHKGLQITPYILCKLAICGLEAARRQIPSVTPKELESRTNSPDGTWTQPATAAESIEIADLSGLYKGLPIQSIRLHYVIS